LPLGSKLINNGINFAVYSKNATNATLVIFAGGKREPFAEVEFDPIINKTGDIWHMKIEGLSSGIRYGYRFDKVPNENPSIHRYNVEDVLIDPYTKLITGADTWGEICGHEAGDGVCYPVRNRRGVVFDSDDYDWEDDRPIKRAFAETVIYEMHVRGFTFNPNSKVKNRGTFSGLIEKIPYLKELGITAVELLPIYEFEETYSHMKDPFTGKNLLNFWGYHPINFFSPKLGYGVTPLEPESVIKEFKDMVKAYHRAGIEVILDVVFNHTCEGDHRGHTFSFRGVDNQTYYMLDEDGNYKNYSGCGNTINCNHPVVREMILDSLRYWVMEMHVDGFRFDLASILGRGRDGEVLSSPPLLEHIANDPILANVKLIAEAWDAAGLYQVGSFPSWGRWAEWNGKFRDDVRRFVKSDPQMAESISNKLLGSPDVYLQSERTPYHSINFITCHDGFTLNDLVSYNEKHNYANGEENQDGCNDNFSWNCGAEGPTSDKNVLALRKKQMKNLAAILMLSDGVPMILAGDEFCRTQKGNNNAYCQDNEISWVDWSLKEKNFEFFRFFKNLIKLRRYHPILKFEDYASLVDDVEVKFLDNVAREIKFKDEDRAFGMHIRLKKDYEDVMDEVYMYLNFDWTDKVIILPKTKNGGRWCYIFDTSRDYPYDFMEGRSFLDNQEVYHMNERSILFISGVK